MLYEVAPLLVVQDKATCPLLPVAERPVGAKGADAEGPMSFTWFDLALVP
jgi:hypothetical protein